MIRSRMRSAFSCSSGPAADPLPLLSKSLPRPPICTVKSRSGPGNAIPRSALAPGFSRSGQARRRRVEGSSPAGPSEIDELAGHGSLTLPADLTQRWNNPIRPTRSRAPTPTPSHTRSCGHARRDARSLTENAPLLWHGAATAPSVTEAHLLDWVPVSGQ